MGYGALLLDFSGQWPCMSNFCWYSSLLCSGFRLCWFWVLPFCFYLFFLISGRWPVVHCFVLCDFLVDFCRWQCPYSETNIFCIYIAWLFELHILHELVVSLIIWYSVHLCFSDFLLCFSLFLVFSAVIITCCCNFLSWILIEDSEYELFVLLSKGDGKEKEWCWSQQIRQRQTAGSIQTKEKNPLFHHH